MSALADARANATVAAAVETALAQVPDPCMVAAGIPASVIELGLLDGVAVEQGRATITITLTEIGCPFTHDIMTELTDAAMAVEGVEEVAVQPRWAPMWSEERLAPEGRRKLAAARARMTGGAR
jgi:metal-sulfur cluster biosynthetic enzyme